MSNGTQKEKTRPSLVGPKPYGRLRAARIDGRTQNVFYRRNELFKLYNTLINNVSTLQEALMRDSGISHQEAQLEFFLSLSAIRDHYVGLSPNNEHEKEYSVAIGHSTADRRLGYGLVHIIPSRYTLLYSVIAPLSAAIAAGNCIVLELEKDLLGVSKVLQSALTENLDADTFCFSEKQVDDEEFLAECLRVDQTRTPRQPFGSVLPSPTDAHTIAIVDRDADLNSAADCLVAARFFFKGKSPYGPDLVLVNEFVKKDFLDAVIKRMTRLMAESIDSGKPHSSLSEETLKMIRNSESRVVLTGSVGALLDVKSRSDPLLKRKSHEPLFIVHSTTSLDDAIDFANSFGTALAGYFFTTLKAAKYLSQFVDCHISLINHIPTSLLVGPPSPTNHPPSPYHRYYPEMFSVPRPIFCQSQPSSSTKFSAKEKIHAHILTSDPQNLAQDLKRFGSSLLTPLPESESEMSRPKKHNIGFFEQGLLTGISVLALAGVGLSYCLYRVAYTGRAIVKGRS